MTVTVMWTTTRRMSWATCQRRCGRWLGWRERRGSNDGVGHWTLMLA